jgi:hypothetical protein
MLPGTGNALRIALRHLTSAGLAVATCAAIAGTASDDPEALSRLVADLDSLHRVTATPHKMADSTITFCRIAFNPNVHEGDHEPAFCHVYVTHDARKAMATGEGPYPRGAVVVKAKLKHPSGGDATLYTVMRKMPAGYDDEHGDWEYSVLDGTSKRVLARGRIESCLECHKEYAASDHVSRVYVKQD